MFEEQEKKICSKEEVDWYVCESNKNAIVEKHVNITVNILVNDSFHLPLLNKASNKLKL